VAGWRGSAGTLRRNPIVGIRTTLILNSDTAWDAAHRAARSTPHRPPPTHPPDERGGLAIVITGLVWMLAWIVAAGVVGTRAAEKTLESEGE
jgi:hypothetical protein